MKYHRCVLFIVFFLRTCSYPSRSLRSLPPLFQQQLVHCVFRHFWRTLFALYFSQTLSRPVTGSARREADVDDPWHWGKAGKRGGEGGLGKALQIRSNYSTPPPPPLFCSYWISAASLRITSRPCPLLSHQPSSGVGLSVTSVSGELFFLFFVFPRCLLCALCLPFFWRSTSPNCVYVGSRDRVNSSFLPLLLLPRPTHPPTPTAVLFTVSEPTGAEGNSTERKYLAAGCMYVCASTLSLRI